MGTDNRTVNTDNSVGAAIKQLRISHDLSIRSLSVRSGVTHTAISKIERDHQSPSVSTLKQLLSVLGTTLSDFFAPTRPLAQATFYKADELLELADGQALSYRQVGESLSGRSLLILHEKYQPGASTGEEPYAHVAEEGGVVVSGKMRMTVGNQSTILEAGDAYYFDSRLPHKMENIFDEECEVVSAVTPPTF